MTISGWASAAAAALLFCGQALAQQVQTVNYTCNLGGVPAQLVAQVETIADTGVTYNDRGITGVIGTGNVKLRYAGQLVSSTARYTFTGEDGFADFVDMTTNDRFIVQFILQGNQLLLIANPHGPEPAQYLCQAG